jgi:hypothetical protein
VTTAPIEQITDPSLPRLVAVRGRLWTATSGIHTRLRIA